MTVIKPGYRFGVLFDGSDIAVKAANHSIELRRSGVLLVITGDDDPLVACHRVFS